MGIHRWFTGFFLLVVMMAALFINAWVFSARSFQDNFAKVTGNGSGAVSMRAIDDATREVATLQAKAAPAEIKAAGIKRQIDDAEGDIDALVKQQNDGAAALAAKIAPLEAAAKLTVPAEATTYASVAGRVQRLEATDGVNQAEVTPLRASVDQLSVLNDKITQAEDAKKALDQQLLDVQTELSAAQQGLMSQQTLFGGNFQQIQTEIESLKNSSPLGIGATLAQIHPTFLSVLLVCLMGALGSMLFLFPAYIANKPGMQITFETIVVRTAFGAVVAFAFFVVANLGIAVFGITSGAGAQPGAAALNPFTIAGLGIVAGVMGDDIAQWIHDRGAYLFKSTGDGGLVDIARNAVTASTSATPAAAKPAVAPAPSDLPSGGLVNPHGGPGDPS